MKPELLAPAGSFEALRAAVDAGADAVYFGLSSFNARKNAENFTLETVGDAIRLCRLFGVKTHIVLNTALLDKELREATDLAGKLLEMGADAFIVADLGLASLLKRTYPRIVLHASTQACGQNVLSAKRLAELGFSRMVAARELPYRDILTLTKDSPIETEIFIHGALCVCHSGQCLMSSVIGGRSGNRGECAQPCRLPYRTKNEYPLSLRDLCLAEHIPEITASGVASLKIEGRMKSPDYVYGVVSIYRKLIDEDRHATAKEMETLSKLFSRSGFTDGYFTEKITGDMLGIRTEEDKRSTPAVKCTYGTRRLPLTLVGTFLAGEKAKLCGTVTRNGECFTASVEGEICNLADKTPTGRERLAENLSKLGATIFTAEKVEVTENGVNIPISAVNALRRALCAALEEKLLEAPVSPHAPPAKAPLGNGGEAPAFPHAPPTETPLGNGGEAPAFPPLPPAKKTDKSAYFLFFDRLTSRAIAYFDRIFLPLSEYVSHPEASRFANIGVAFPPVMMDHERDGILTLASKAASLGCRMALVSGLWQAELADNYGWQKHGAIRLNVWNTEGVAVYEKMGFCSLVVSAEIGVPAGRGLRSNIPCGLVVYGRLPLMTLEKCIIRDNANAENGAKCDYCQKERFFMLTDRKGVRFPVCREYQHRNVVYNSVPVYMLDRLTDGLSCHYIFTTETPTEVDAVLTCAEKKASPKSSFKRL